MDKPIELTTERLLLRRHRPEDLDDLIECNNSPGFQTYWFNVAHYFTRQEAEKLLAMILNTANWEHQEILANFAIVLDGKAIGEVHFNQHKDDRENERAELVYSLSSYHWNKGLTTEAARAVVDWAFQTCNLNRIYAWCDPRNIGSWRVMEKLGMEREGLFRRHDKAGNGEFRDQLYYGILREEWKSSR